MSVYNIDGSALSAVYNISGTSVGSAYDISGNQVFSSSSGSVDYSDYTLTSLYTTGQSYCQGIAIYNDVLFQFLATGSSVADMLSLYDFTDGSTIYSDMTIDSDHGDSATFSNEFYSTDDEFPLIYVTADTTPAVIYVNRVTRESASLVRTLVFPSSAGYYGAGAFDWDNNICYLVAYKESNYTTDNDGSNTTVVSLWDLSDLTDNGDDTYTPAYIDQYERDFIYVMQGLAYHDGYIWISSGSSGTTGNVYAMNPDTGVIDYTITMDTLPQQQSLPRSRKMASGARQLQRLLKRFLKPRLMVL